MCSWRDAPNPQPTYQPPAGSTFLIFFMPVVIKVQTQSENVTFWTLLRILSQFSWEIWNIWDCVCVIYHLCDIRSSKQSHNHVQGVISPTLVTRKLDHGMYSLSGYNTDIREAFTTCRGSARFPAGTREPHPCFLLLVCLCVLLCSTCPADVEEEGILPTLANMHTSYLHTMRYMCTHIMSTRTKPGQPVWLTKTWLSVVQCGALICRLYQQVEEEEKQEEDRIWFG